MLINRSIVFPLILICKLWTSWRAGNFLNIFYRFSKQVVSLLCPPKDCHVIRAVMSVPMHVEHDISGRVVSTTCGSGPRRRSHRTWCRISSRIHGYEKVKSRSSFTMRCCVKRTWMTLICRNRLLCKPNSMHRRAATHDPHRLPQQAAIVIRYISSTKSKLIRNENNAATTSLTSGLSSWRTTYSSFGQYFNVHRQSVDITINVS